ncbi:MAG: imidazole glycerol phosphate synthase subunit HisH [Nitrospirota bacterium]
MIAIVDYGSGNVKAFANIYRRLGVPFLVAEKALDLRGATKVILPGVGAFDHVMRRLAASGMREALDEVVLARRLPILGVCVGMQVLANSSEEGDLPGLGWVDGAVKRFDVATLTHATYLPHMGWNDVRPMRESGLFRDLSIDYRFYFLHSYYFQCSRTEDVIAVTDYGGPFSSAVNNGNIFGVQFHPEKSHEWGIQLLQNFANLC